MSAFCYVVHLSPYTYLPAHAWMSRVTSPALYGDPVGIFRHIVARVPSNITTTSTKSKHARCQTNIQIMFSVCQRDKFPLRSSFRIRLKCETSGASLFASKTPMDPGGSSDGHPKLTKMLCATHWAFFNQFGEE